MSSASPEPTPLARSVACAGLPLLIVVAVLVVFAPALEAGFLHWDDDVTITQNPHFRGFAREQIAWMFSTGLLGHFQPLAWLTFALDHTLDPLLAPDFLAARTFHRSNLIWHAAAGLAVYWASLELLAAGLRRRRVDPAVVFGAGFASLFFAIHPLRVESVAWVTERRDLVSGTFFALALVAWTRYGRAAGGSRAAPRAMLAGNLAAVAALALFWLSVERGATSLAWRGPGPWGLGAGLALLGLSAFVSAAPLARGPFLAALACLVVSLGAKAWGMVLPVLFLLLDVAPLARATDWRGRVTAVREKLPFFALALAFASLAAWAQGIHAYTQPDLAVHTPLERVAQAGYGVVFYPWKTLLPGGLVALVELPPRLPLVSWRFGLPLLLACALTLAALALLRRWPLVTLAWIAYLATVAPVLGFLQSGPQLVADRYAYLALLPPTWLLAGALARLFALGGPARVVVLVGAGAWLVALGLRAQRQTHVWHDDLSLWSHAYVYRPDGPQVQKQLAFAYIQEARGEPDAARQYELYAAAGDLLERARQVTVDALTYGNLSLVHRAMVTLDPGSAAQHSELALSLAQLALEEARKTGYELADYRLNLGALYVDLGRFDEAIAEFEAVTRDKPTFGFGWMNLGIALGRAGRFDDAERAFATAIELLPRSGEPWLHLGKLCEARGERERARTAFEQGLARAPEDPNLRAGLERVR